MRVSKISFMILTFLVGVEAQAQQKGKTVAELQYNVAIPAGSFKQTVSETSFRGGQAKFMYGVSDHFAVGFGLAFQDFYQKVPRQVYKLNDGSDLSAVRSFSVQTIPLLAQAKYQFAPGAAIQPYAAVGVGGNLISYTDMVGQFSLEETAKFGFAARPEAGVFIPFKKTGEAGLMLGASYNIMPFNSSASSNLNNIGIHAGVAVPLRK